MQSSKSSHKGLTWLVVVPELFLSYQKIIFPLNSELFFVLI